MYLYVPLPCATFTFTSIAWFRHVQNVEKLCPFPFGFGWLCGEKEFKHLSKIVGTVIPHR
jgi:hypothetical protein